MVRRTTAIAVVIRLASTNKLTASALCPKSWTSNNSTSHRRTVILFNELHSLQDTVPFTAWISPDSQGSKMWNLPANCDTPVDTEASALVFIQRFISQVWKGVVSELENVIDECSKHIIYWVGLLYLWIDHLLPKKKS